MNKLTSKQKRKIIDKWIWDNGAAKFDLKTRDIILCDGGLFSIEKNPIKLHKITGWKELPNGNSQAIFSKKKYKDNEYAAVFWFEELDENIEYLKRMKKMLNSIGYDTSKSLRWQRGLNGKTKKRINQ